MSEQLTLNMTVPEGPIDDAPLVYVASPLTHLDQTGRAVVCSWVHIVRSALTEIHVNSTNGFPRLRTHVPALQTAPWADVDSTPEQIYRLNRQKVQTDCDLLVVVACGGVSGGVGQEIEWADAALVPALYLHPMAEPVSKQLSGHPRVHTATFNPTNPDTLADAVKAFVRQRRRQLIDGPQRRRERTLRFTPTARAMRNAWSTAGPHRQNEALALAHFDADDLAFCIANPLLFAAMPYGTLDALASALGIRLGETVAWPDLSPGERNALLIAAEEANWPARRVFHLQDAARLERARGGTRRFQLGTPQDWYDFEQQLP